MWCIRRHQFIRVRLVFGCVKSAFHWHMVRWCWKRGGKLVRDGEKERDGEQKQNQWLNSIPIIYFLLNNRSRVYFFLVIIEFAIFSFLFLQKKKNKKNNMWICVYFKIPFAIGANRISVVFRVRSAKAVKITDATLLKRLGIICLCVGIGLLVRTIVAPPVVIVGRTADDLKAFLCKADWWDHTFTTSEYFCFVAFCNFTFWQHHNNRSHFVDNNQRPMNLNIMLLSRRFSFRKKKKNSCPSTYDRTMFKYILIEIQFTLV